MSASTLLGTPDVTVERNPPRRLEEIMNGILLDVDPSSDYELFLRLHLANCIKSQMKVVVITPEGSPLHQRIAKFEGISVVLMALSADETGSPAASGVNKISVVTFDKAVVLDLLASLVAIDGRTALILDSISTLCLFFGFTTTYELIRRSIEILYRSAKGRVHALSLVYSAAHAESELTMLRSLFPVLVRYSGGTFEVTKPKNLRLEGSVTLV